MGTEVLGRTTHKILYVFEDGFSYTSVSRSEFIPITERQYREARKNVQERGSIIEDSDSSHNAQYLLEGNLVRFTIPNMIQLPRATRLIEILSEKRPAFLRNLVEELGLPLPR